MNELDYSAAGVPIRDEVRAAHRHIWEFIGTPGNWWTGAERVAIAAAAPVVSAPTATIARANGASDARAAAAPLDGVTCTCRYDGGMTSAAPASATPMAWPWPWIERPAYVIVAM